MYLALDTRQSVLEVCGIEDHLPLGWVPFLLDVCEDAFGFVVLAIGTCWHLAIAFDFLLPAHIASLTPILVSSQKLGCLWSRSILLRSFSFSSLPARCPRLRLGYCHRHIAARRCSCRIWEGLEVP